MSTGAVPDTRMKQPGGAGPAHVTGGVAAGGAAGAVAGQVRRDQPLQQEHQEFDSWRHQTHQQGYNPMSSMASDPYLSSFYAGSYHYPGFGVGDGKQIHDQAKCSYLKFFYFSCRHLVQWR